MKTAESTIKEEALTAFANLLFENSNYGISIYEVPASAKFKGRKLVFCNDRFVEMSGRRRRELMDTDRVTNFQNRVWVNPNSDFEMNKGPMEGTSSWDRPDGTANYHDWAAWQVELREQRYVLAISRDVTAREQSKLRLGTVHDVTENISKHLDLQKLLHATLISVVKVMDAEAGSVMLIDDEGTNVYVAAAVGPGSDDISGKKMCLAESVAGKVIMDGEAQVIHKGFDSTRFPKFIRKKRKILSALSVPIIAYDDAQQIGMTLGVINVNRINHCHMFLEADRSFLLLLSKQIAMAIQNARMYQREKERAEKLGALESLRSDFISSVTHELRTPLTALKGFTELLRQERPGMSVVQREQSWDSVQRSIRRLDQMVTEILTFSSLERGSERVNQIEVDLKKLLDQVVATSGMLSDRHQIVVTMTGKARTLWCDPERIEQCLLNLLSNAIKYSPNGGRVAVHVKWGEVEVGIGVTDSGIGIPPEQLDKVFERYYRVTGAGREGFGGNGIGLSIVKSLVELHGGRLLVRSVVDEGTTFTLLLPITATEDRDDKLALE